MVEREWMGLLERDPFGRGRVVAPDGPPPTPFHQERDGGGGFAWVSLRTRVHPEKFPGPRSEPGLLPELSNHGLFHGLAKLHESPWKGPHP